MLDEIEMARAGEQDRGAGLDEVVYICGHEDAAADGVDIVPGASGALEGAADALGSGEHDDEIDRADIDAELERSGADHRAELAALEPVLDILAQVAIERGVVALDRPREIRAGLAQPDVEASAPERVLVKTSVVGGRG